MVFCRKTSSLVLLFVYSTTVPAIAQTSGTTEFRPSDGESPFARARGVKLSVETWSSETRKELKKLRELHGSLDLKKIENKKVVLKQLRDVINQLMGEASDIVDASGSFEVAFKRYGQAVLDAPTALEEIAKEQEKIAKSEPSEFFQKSYYGNATILRKWAEHYKKKSREIDDLNRNVQGKIEFVRRSIRFLENLDRVLSVIPESDAAGAEVAQYIRRVNDYIDVLKEAIDSFKNTADKMTGPSSSRSSKPQTNPRKTRRPLTSIGFSEYRQQLANLKN